MTSRHAKPARLSNRELEVVQHRRLGRTYKEVSEQIGISINTVKRHLARAFTKLGARNSLEAARLIHPQ